MSAVKAQVTICPYANFAEGTLQDALLESL